MDSGAFEAFGSPNMESLAKIEISIKGYFTITFYAVLVIVIILNLDSAISRQIRHRHSLSNENKTLM